jgi:hypothetical protein
MKFTLSLHDYIEQYLTNVDLGHMHCPVCYEQHMTHMKPADMKEMLECYKDQVIEAHLYKHMQEHGELPIVDEQFVDGILDQIEYEMATYCQQRQ